ncbi:hypothetical protein COI69_30100 [Bacillus cereus]|uniref:Uncharacterized protein n=1 Tax=Bacillus cereus TaxID=1396 RepID=A0A9X7E0T0_BACCE|nr:hypothetical protein [Bacillus cereus]PHA26084.1 hypothetical protein COE70_02270 [Bacillus cereus]PHG74462.1 hypothetical protein COI69_30100 [Bacillus cereus]
MEQKQFWRWLFQEIDYELLYIFKSKIKIVVRGFRINSAQDIKKENHPFVVNTFLQPANLKKIKKYIQAVSVIKNIDDDFELELEKIIKRVESKNDLIETVLYLVQEKNEEMAIDVYTYFCEKLDELPNSVENEEVESTDKKVINMKKEDSIKTLEAKIKKIEADLLKVRNDLKKRVDENKTLKVQIKNDRKQWTSKLNETKKSHEEQLSKIKASHEEQLTESKRLYEEQIATHKNRELNLNKRIEELVGENKSFVTAHEELEKETIELTRINKEYEELFELYDQENIRGNSGELRIIIIGRPMNIIKTKNPDINIEILNNIEFKSYQFPKSDKCWVLPFTLNNRERTELQHNAHFSLIENVEYFDDYLKLMNALKNIEKVEVRV